MFRFHYYLSALLIVAFVAGCGVRAETYVMTKDRVGIDYKGGNAGFIAGSPQYQTPQKKTRKVYVLELSKPVPESEVRKIEQEAASSHGRASIVEVSGGDDAVATSEPQRLIIDPILDEPEAESSSVSSEATAYTVEKDDTLQKIAKKFYNSYGKWMLIYDANKDKIKNPNFVKPGTVLMIPAADEKS